MLWKLAFQLLSKLPESRFVELGTWFVYEVCIYRTYTAQTLFINAFQPTSNPTREVSAVNKFEEFEKAQLLDLQLPLGLFHFGIVRIHKARLSNTSNNLIS